MGESDNNLVYIMIGMFLVLLLWNNTGLFSIFCQSTEPSTIEDFTSELVEIYPYDWGLTYYLSEYEALIYSNEGISSTNLYSVAQGDYENMDNVKRISISQMPTILKSHLNSTLDGELAIGTTVADYVDLTEFIDKGDYYIEDCGEKLNLLDNTTGATGSSITLDVINGVVVAHGFNWDDSTYKFCSDDGRFAISIWAAVPYAAGADNSQQNGRNATIEYLNKFYTCSDNEVEATEEKWYNDIIYTLDNGFEIKLWMLLIGLVSVLLIFIGVRR